jgi:putative hydrolase of the HAD superfamily
MMTPPDSDIGAVLFDAMGTLLALAPPAPILRQELARRFAVSLTLQQAEVAMAAEIAYYRLHMHDATDAVGVQALREASAEALRAALPVTHHLPGVDSASLAEALVASLHFTAYPDAVETLPELRRRGLHVVVVSNWDCSLDTVLEDVGLGSYLDAVVTSAVAGSAKPDTGIFAAALEQAGVEADRALHVGDSLEEDVAGARAAGLPAVWCNRARAGAPDGVTMVSDLRELIALV